MILTKLLALLIGTSLNLSGSFFLAKTIIKSESEISDMSTTFWNGNPLMPQSQAKFQSLRSRKFQTLI